LTLLVCAVATFGQSLTVAADQGRLWLMLPEPERPGMFTLLHHGPGDPANQLSKVTMLRGEVESHGVAARGESLWMIYSDGTIQSIHAVPTPLKDGWVYQRRVEPSLPAGVLVRAAVLTEAGPWVLVRVEGPQGLEAIQSTAKPKGPVELEDQARRRRNLALGLPLGYQRSKSPSETPLSNSEPNPPAQAVDPPEISQASGPTTFPVDRLLSLDRGKWRVHTLPTDWAHAAQAWLVHDRPKAKRPTLVTLTHRAHAQTRRVDVFRWQTAGDPAWESESYTSQARVPDARFEILSVESQLVLAELNREGEVPTALLTVLRGGKTLPVGRMSLQGPAPQAWSLLGLGNTAALIAWTPVSRSQDTPHPGYGLTWTRMDLRGNTLHAPADLTVKTRSAMDDIAQYAGLVFVVVLASVLMLAFWRRDSDWNRLQLPDGLVVADLGRRVLAAGIDLAPGLLGVMFYFGLSIDELTYRWPGNGLVRTFQQMLPGLLVIAVFVGHSTLSELFFARTLGKAVTGLRTTKLDGTRPKAWQLLVRGLMKILDMLPFAWLLLILPVIAPHRQRLGDLVGRTVVVSDAPKEESADEDEEDQDQDDSG